MAKYLYINSIPAYIVSRNLTCHEFNDMHHDAMQHGISEPTWDHMSWLIAEFIKYGDESWNS